MFTVESASVEDILQNHVAVDSEPFCDGSDAVRTERSFSVDVCNFSGSTSQFRWKLCDHAECMRKLCLPSAVLAVHLCDRLRHDAALWPRYIIEI